MKWALGRLQMRVGRLEAQDASAPWERGAGLSSLLAYAQAHPAPFEVDDLCEDAQRATGLCRLLREAREGRQC